MKSNFRLYLFLICLLLTNCIDNTPQSPIEPPIQQLPEQETDTPTPTITLTPTPTLTNTELYAVTKEISGCFYGTSQIYQKLTDIPQFEIVMVLGKNNVGNWFQIRWNEDGVTKDCWVEANLINPNNFSLDGLTILSTPPPPTFTPTPTKIVVINSPTRKRSNDSNNPVLPITKTPIPNTPVPKTPIPNTPVPKTPIPNTPVPNTSVPNTPVPNTPVPNTSVPNTPAPNTSVPNTPVPTTCVNPQGHEIPCPKK